MLESMKRRAGVLSALTVLAFVTGMGAASATPADPVEQGFTDAGTKVALYGGLLITLVLIGFGIMLGVKYLSKGFRKA